MCIVQYKTDIYTRHSCTSVHGVVFYMLEVTATYLYNIIINYDVWCNLICINLCIHSHIKLIRYWDVLFSYVIFNRIVVIWTPFMWVSLYPLFVVIIHSIMYMFCNNFFCEFSCLLIMLKNLIINYFWL